MNCREKAEQLAESAMIRPNGPHQYAEFLATIERALREAAAEAQARAEAAVAEHHGRSCKFGFSVIEDCGPCIEMLLRIREGGEG